MIPIFKDVKTKMFELNAQIGNTGKETETIKEPNENFKTKKYNT